MCGIFGFCSQGSNLPELETLDRCRDSLSHRGPNASGRYHRQGVYLGFRRLAILDLSIDANQPMTTPDGRYTLVFNGEIYNYLELRDDLEKSGHRFRTTSDTEVLLTLCAESGVGGLARINGMFAFALYDNVERTLLLVRDRLGVKPLFYWKRDRDFAFASEICALRPLPEFPKAIDPEALGLYLRSGGVPEWACIYKGVSKLPPGCWVRYHLQTGFSEGPVSYWDLPPVHEDDGRTEDDWVDEIEALLWDATRIRLRSDVPLGIFLSGGIDSAMVSAAAAKQVRGLTSLTIGFAGEPEDETALALETARHLGLNPITRNVDVREGLQLLPRVIGHFDEPFSDTSALPTALVSAEARKDFTVVLSGDGGDEVFGGYRQHVLAWRWRWVDRLPLWARRGPGALLAGISRPDTRSKRFFQRLRFPVGRYGLGGPLYFYQNWLEDCLKPEFVLPPQRLIDLYDKYLPEWKGASSIDLSQRTDVRQFLLEDILIKVDRMSMLHSLEVRSPFLDYRMVELGLRIPSRLRVKNGQNKYLLRKLAARHLPQRVCHAPKKGFSIPVYSWLDKAFRSGVLVKLLAQNQDGFPDPFGDRGAEKLCRLGIRTCQAFPLLQLLCYRWWCQARLSADSVESQGNLLLHCELAQAV